MATALFERGNNNHCCCEQVGDACRRMGSIKLIGTSVPQLLPSTRRMAVSDACIVEDIQLHVSASVWMDLLGDHVGATFAPELRMSARLYGDEMASPDGNGK
jgi:hypothetical protein